MYKSRDYKMVSKAPMKYQKNKNYNEKEDKNDYYSVGKKRYPLVGLKRSNNTQEEEWSSSNLKIKRLKGITFIND